MKSLKFWLGIAVSAVLVWWALSRVDLAGLGQSLADTNYWWLAACVPVFYLQYVIRALRWDYLLRPVKKIGYPSLLASTVIGFTGNLLLPLRLGEIIRAVDIGRREGVPKTAALTTILLERILDGLAIIPLFLGSALYLGVFNLDHDMAGMAKTGIIIFSGIYAAMLVVVVGLALKPGMSLSLAGWLVRPLPEKVSRFILELAEHIIDGLKLIRNPRDLAIASAYTIVLWLMLATPLWFLARGVGHPVSFTAALFVNGLTCLFIAIPSSPGFVGTMHYAIQFGLGVLLGMSQERALSVGILFHGGTFIFTVLYCLTFLVRGKVSLLDLGRKADKTT